jgi:hypothetical protein
LLGEWPGSAKDLADGEVAYLFAGHDGVVREARCVYCDSTRFNFFTFERYLEFQDLEFLPKKAPETSLSPQPSSMECWTIPSSLGQH